METKDIIVFAAVAVALGFSIYRKYMKNKQEQGGSGSNKGKDTSFSSSKDDDYEPYSDFR